MSIDPILSRAIEEWRRGDHYEAHETLEELIESDQFEDHDFAITMGLIHIAAAIHKLTHQVTPEGVPNKLRHALEELRDAPAQWRGIALSRFIAETRALLAAVERNQTPENMPTI